MSKNVLEKLKARFGSAVLEMHSDFGDDTALVDSASWRDICHWLRTDPQMDFDMPTDLCGVDYPNRGWSSGGGAAGGRIEVVAHLYSTSKRHRIRLKTRVGDEDGEGAELDSITPIWAGMNWLERECYDLVGVKFRGHPDLRRILLYPEFEGHPLRKDYPANKTQPLVAYRTEEEAGLPIEKIEPFGPDEGMPFGRKEWQRNQEEN